LYREVSSIGIAARRKIPGIGPRRAEIIVAGAAVLHAMLDQLRVPRLYYSAAGLRDGIIADLAHRGVEKPEGRLDPEQRSAVQWLGRHYGISRAHANKVAQLAGMLFHGMQPLHRLPTEQGKLLEAAAHLYNIGHYVNEMRHHRHSLYLVANSDLPGFPDRDRLIIANLCRYHRRSMPLASHEAFATLDADAQRSVMLLAPLLRLAVALDQSQEQRVEHIEMRIGVDVELLLFSGKNQGKESLDIGRLDIEQWHAQRTASVFREVYGRELEIRTN
jgi:exopolyphosphatase/guanosine-5'-triphosphate,3'-diphosphate pyrophosphatase